MTTRSHSAPWMLGLLAIAALVSLASLAGAQSPVLDRGTRLPAVVRTPTKAPALLGAHPPGCVETIGYTTNEVIQHYETLDGSGLASARADLVTQGHTLVPVNSLVPGSLDGLDRLIVGVVNNGIALSAAQVDVIEAFVRSGHTLVFIGENNLYFRDNNVAVGGRFGIQYPPPGDDPPQIVLTDVGTHPIMQGPYGNVTTVDGSANSPGAYGSMSSPGPYGHSILDFPGGSSACVVIEPGALGAGSGLVVAVAEVNIWDHNYDSAGNRAFWNNIFAYCPGASANHPPDCSGARASVAELWPPDHKYKAISVEGVTDPDGDPMTITVTGITQDEPVNGTGDGNTCPDGQIVDGQASVRAERSGTPGVPGDGRVYAIHFTASDGRGGECEGLVNVCVPHDHGDPTCVDNGQKYNSLGPCRAGDGSSAEAVTSYGFTVGSSGSRVALEFALPEDADVEIAAFDVAGRRVVTLENGRHTTGVYQRSWDMSGIPNGMYFVRMRAGTAVLTRTVIRAQ